MTADTKPATAGGANAHAHNLAPNKADMVAHLYALFPPAFVQAYPDARVEIAYANMAGSEKPDEAETFSAFDLQRAADFAEMKSRAGFNVYVGAALRRAECRGRTGAEGFVDASHAWADFDKQGDDARVHADLKEKNLQPSLIVQTGSTPHRRFQVYLRHADSVTADQARDANTALRDWLGGDNVQGAGNLMRLAGSINHPSREKREERGYIAELVTLHIRKDAPAYTVEQLTGAAPRRQGAGATEEKPAPTVESFFKNVNQLALVNISKWVRALFGEKIKFHAGTGAWRITSKDLGRNLEEDLEISQRIVWDYGTEQASNPIQLVIEYGPRKSSILGETPTAPDAALWLCEQMDIAPDALGWGTPPQGPQDAHPQAIQHDDFYAYMLEHKYIYTPLGAVWPAASVDARLAAVGKLKASTWLDKNRPVEQMTWVPGEPVEIKGRLIVNGGWIERPGSRAFNLYRAPALKPTAGNADRWVHHVERLYGEDAAHVVKWCAHRVQKPADKINHALVLGGRQGIGKDTLLEPVKYAVGAWNFNEVSPVNILGRFNGFLKSVVLRVSEARDLGDSDRFAFYDHMKSITAAPPDVLRIDEKNRQEYAIPNVCGVIITTNHKSDGIYLPADDRRHFVAWSDLDKSAFDAAYWAALWQWYAEDGLDVVAHYLQNLDLTGFNPKATPPQTSAFFEIVNSSRTPEDAEFADALDVLAWPKAVTIAALKSATPSSDFVGYLDDRRNSRRIPHRFEACGYTPVRNPHTEDGLWRPHGRRQVIYARSTLDHGARVRAAADFERGKPPPGRQ